MDIRSFSVKIMEFSGVLLCSEMIFCVGVICFCFSSYKKLNLLSRKPVHTAINSCFDEEISAQLMIDFSCN